LALVTSQMRNFGREDFARFHPAGALGRRLSKVDHHLRPLEQCRIAPEDCTVREAFVSLSMPGRRTGAIMLVDGQGRLTGVFTDSDLARLLERRREHELDGPIRAVMTANPVSVPLGALMLEAVALMARRKISELPVVDPQGRPAGLIDVTDVVGLFPGDGAAPEEPAQAVNPSPPPGEFRLFGGRESA
jgi:arabinose-5-phosphate isomerase